MDYYDLDQPFDDDIPDYDIYEPTSAEIWTSCTWPSIQQIYKYFLPFVFWNISFRIVTQASMPCSLLNWYSRAWFGGFNF